MTRIRDDDSPDICGEALRAEGKYYTRGRLQDGLRMKPASDAELVRMYKSPYGRKYGVWRLADCVPVQAKRPQTEKQRQASAHLNLLARVKSKRGRLAMLAHTWLALGPAFLDTETIGLDAGVRTLEISLVNARSGGMFETRLKPIVAIDPAVTAIRGISDEDLVRTPPWSDIVQQLQRHIGRHPLVIFSVESNTRILKQTAAAHNDPTSWLDSLTVYYIMWLAAGYYGPTNRYGTISLSDAVSQVDLCWVGEAHSAVTDAVMTTRVVSNIVEYRHKFQCEINDDAGNETTQRRSLADQTAAGVSLEVWSGEYDENYA